MVKTIMLAWEDIVNSDTEEAYIENCNRFKVLCVKFPKFVEYVQSTILGPVKENIVKSWVNKVMHKGNTTTNRVESAHNRLKKYLTNSMGDLSTIWQQVHNMLESQHTQIRTSFQTSIIMLEHRFKGKRLWYSLIRNILRKALHYLADEADRAADIETDKFRCGCLSLITFGLPCVCV
jgi:hypothetical protein